MAGADRPAAEGLAPGHFPASPVGVGHVEPAPRRVRGMVGGEWVFDTTSAWYAWEHPYYPQLHIPAGDVRIDLLRDDGDTTTTPLGEAAQWTLCAGGPERTGAAHVLRTPPHHALADTFRFRWSALDRWFEEDEEVFVHPRSPYVRVDALASARPVRVELADTVLADAPGSVVVFETGLPPRFYVAKSHIRWEHLDATDTVTRCAYKGTTTGWWTARVPGAVADDVAWAYDHPTHQIQPAAGLVAFLGEDVDLIVDGRPWTP